MLPLTQTITKDDYRQWILGGSFDWAISEWVLRGETTYIPTLYLPSQQSTAFSIYQNYQQSAWVLGLDRSIGEWFLSAQIFETVLFGGTTDPLLDRKQRWISFLVTRSFLQDRLKMRVFTAAEISKNKSGWFNFSVTHEPMQNLEISAGWDLLRGSSLSVFGAIKEESRINLGIKLYF